MIRIPSFFVGFIICFNTMFHEQIVTKGAGRAFGLRALPPSVTKTDETYLYELYANVHCRF